MTRRLAKLVGSRDGRPVYVGTLCDATGTRRLAKDTGVVVDGRRVFVSAECGEECVASFCCADQISRLMFVTVVFKGVGAGTVTIPIIFDSPGAYPLYRAFSWYGYIDRGSVCGNSAKYLHVHFMCGVEGWQISLVCRASTTPPHPAFNGSGFMTFLVLSPANTCDPFHQELSEMELNLITASGDTSCFDGTGCTGASSLVVSATDPAAVGVRTGCRALAKRLTDRDGRTVHVGACCPPDPCCLTVWRSVATITLTVVYVSGPTSFCSAGLDGAVYHATSGGGTSPIYSGATVEFFTNTCQVIIDPFGCNLRSTGIVSSDCSVPTMTFSAEDFLGLGTLYYIVITAP